MEQSHAVILSGGGATGSYEIGVLKALFSGDCPHVDALDPDVYTGTSVGSFNAAVMASQQEHEAPMQLADKLKTIWEDEVAEGSDGANGVFRIRGNPIPWFHPQSLLRDPLRPITEATEDGVFLTSDFLRRLLYFSKSDEPMLERILEFPDLGAFISVEPLLELINRHVHPERLKSSSKALRVVATDWLRGLPTVFKKDDVAGRIGTEAILASAAIPAVFPPVRIRDKIYVDGGLTMNTPLKPAIQACRSLPEKKPMVLHVIYLDPELRDIPIAQVPSTFATASRMAMMTFAHSVKRDIHYADQVNQQIGAAGRSRKMREVLDKKQPLIVHRYRPRTDLGGILGLLNFSRDRIQRLIEEGFADTLKHDCHEEGCIGIET